MKLLSGDLIKSLFQIMVKAGILDIALLPALARRENVDDITANYGFVIVDECHHVAASAFFGVLSRIAAR